MMQQQPADTYSETDGRSTKSQIVFVHTVVVRVLMTVFSRLTRHGPRTFVISFHHPRSHLPRVREHGVQKELRERRATVAVTFSCPKPF
jgi:hypothetical protein